MQFKLAAVFLSICSLAAAGCTPGQYVCSKFLVVLSRLKKTTDPWIQPTML